MQQYAEPVTDLKGNVVPGALVTILNLDNTLATLFGADGVSSLDNPVTSDAQGVFTFQAVNGSYRRTVSIGGNFYSIPGTINLYDSADDKQRAVVNSPEAYFLEGDLGWSNAIKRALLSIPNGGSGSFDPVPGKNYPMYEMVEVPNRRIAWNGQNSTFTAMADMPYLFKIDSENCTISDFELNKATGVQIGVALFYLKGIGHKVSGITSRDQKVLNIFHLQDVRESKFWAMTLQCDVSGKTGYAFLMDYCVNNSLSDSFCGFGTNLIKGSNATHPVNGYSNEGFGMENVKAVYFDWPVEAVRFTNLTIDGTCTFDFCKKGGVFVTNGHTLTVAPGAWFACDTAENFIGVGTGPTFDNVHVDGVTFVRNSSAAGAKALSLPGTNSFAKDNIMLFGMDAGIVTQPATPVSLWGNKVAAPGIPLVNEGFQTDVWTPGLSFGGAAVGITYSSRPAKYVKTGNKYEVEFYFGLSSKGTSTGGAVISGLPVVADTTASLYVAVTGYLNGVTGAGPLVGYLTPGTKNITLGYTGPTGFVALTDANFTNTTECAMSFSYFANKA